MSLAEDKPGGWGLKINRVYLAFRQSSYDGQLGRDQDRNVARIRFFHQKGPLLGLFRVNMALTISYFILSADGVYRAMIELYAVIYCGLI